jgi:membrane-associated phospholipid phosphatase
MILFPAPEPIAPPPAAQVSSFRPGEASQDWMTIPIEVGIIASLNAVYTPRAHVLAPFSDEATGLGEKSTTYTRSSLLPYAVGMGAGVFAGLSLANPEFSFYTHVRGLTHALLLSEVANASAKVIVQKARPTYNKQVADNNGLTPDDARASFYSDHANMAFALSTYTSLMMFEYARLPVVASIYAAVALVGATVISFSRVQDHAHHDSDVIVGGVMGTAISALTFYRVREVDRENHPYASSAWDGIHVSPGLWSDDGHALGYTANVQWEIP